MNFYSQAVTIIKEMLLKYHYNFQSLEFIFDKETGSEGIKIEFYSVHDDEFAFRHYGFIYRYTPSELERYGIQGIIQKFEQEFEDALLTNI